jgi:hypothetical protein
MGKQWDFQRSNSSIKTVKDSNPNKSKLLCKWPFFHAYKTGIAKSVLSIAIPFLRMLLIAFIYPIRMLEVVPSYIQ